MCSLRDSSVMTTSRFLSLAAPRRVWCCPSIHILLIAPVALERGDCLLGSFGGQALHVRIGAPQRGAHVLCHCFHVAADIKIRAVVEPLDQVAAFVPDAVL